MSTASHSAALDATIIALADPSRRGAIDLLRRKPRRAGELAEELGLTAPAMSRHLRVLRTSGLVERTFDADDARATVYRLRPEKLVQLRSWLEDIERFWSLQLDAFAAHAERSRGKTRK
jgi:DNA-binding transcriptional ArsR family regulator